MILVTGGLGFLGGNLGKYLLDRGQEVLLTRNRNIEVPYDTGPVCRKGPADCAHGRHVINDHMRCGQEI